MIENSIHYETKLEDTNPFKHRNTIIVYQTFLESISPFHLIPRKGLKCVQAAPIITPSSRVKVLCIWISTTFRNRKFYLLGCFACTRTWQKLRRIPFYTLSVCAHKGERRGIFETKDFHFIKHDFEHYNPRLIEQVIKYSLSQKVELNMWV